MNPELFHFFFTHIASAQRLNDAIIALLIVSIFGALFGAFSGNANPFLWGVLDRVFGRFTKKTYNVQRSVGALHFRGAIILSLYIFLAAVFAVIAVILEKEFPLAGFTTPLLLTCVLSGGATWSALIKLHHAIRAEDKKGQAGKALPKGSFYDIAVSTRTNLNTTDNHGIIRGGIGFVASSFDKGIIAPLFWFLIGGLPAAFIYSGIAAARWGLSKEGFAKGIGHLALSLEWVMGLVPQIISSFIFILAALITPSVGIIRSIAGLFAGNGSAPYAEGGMPLTTLAWGFDVSLGGPVEDIDGSVLKRAWVGPKSSTAKVGIHHLRIAIYLSVIASILTIALLLGGIIAWKSIL